MKTGSNNASTSLTFKLVAWIGLLALCLAPIPAQARGPAGIVGFVHEEGLPGWTVAVSSVNGGFATSVLTDEDGSFRVDLKPGRYVLTPYYVPHPGPGQPVPNFVLMGLSKSVIVLPNQFTRVILATSFGRLPKR